MTKKRFQINGKEIIQNKQVWCMANSEHCADVIATAMNELHEENEQLKQTLKGYHNAFDCSQCRYHNYDWYDDGDEFEVCDKGNNEAQMEYHSCKDWEEL